MTGFASVSAPPLWFMVTTVSNTGQEHFPSCGTGLDTNFQPTNQRTNENEANDGYGDGGFEPGRNGRASLGASQSATRRARGSGGSSSGRPEYAPVE